MNPSISHLLRDASLSFLSCASLSPPSSPSHFHLSSLSSLLDRFPLPFLSDLPPPSSSLSLLLPDLSSSLSSLRSISLLHSSSLQQLHILRSLLHITRTIRFLLLSLADSYGHSAFLLSVPSSLDVPEVVKAERLSLLGLLSSCSQGNQPNVDSSAEFQASPLPSRRNDSSRSGCFEFTTSWINLPWFSRKAPVVELGESEEREEITKRWIEAISVVDKNLDLLRLTLQDINAKLSSTVECSKQILVSCPSRSSFVSSALLRKTLKSFLNANFDREGASLNETCFQSEAAGCVEDVDSITMGEKLHVAKAEELIGNLRDKRGSSIVAICGGTGLGKTSLASFVACDQRIAGHFPGGTYWVSLGRDPDLVSLQKSLWKKITGAKITFSSLEEGTTALTNRFSEGLPGLLVLDDVWDESHVRPFMCFDGKERGRIIVISRRSRTVLSMADTCVHVVGALEEQEALSLFCSIAAWKTPLSTETTSLVTGLARKCVGVPRLIQAVASIFYEDENALRSPLVENLMKIKAFSIEDACDCSEEGQTQEEGAASDAAREDGKTREEGVDCPDARHLLENSENSLQQEAEGAFSSGLLPCFDSLGEVHPCLQECFLDLAAFPKGKWVSLSTLVDIWGVGDGMEEEEIFLVLSLLASRSLIEWKVDIGVDCVDQGNDSDKTSSLHWRLTDGFYELAQAIIESSLDAFQSGEEERFVEKRSSLISQENEKRISKVSIQETESDTCKRLGICFQMPVHEDTSASPDDVEHGYSKKRQLHESVVLETTSRGRRSARVRSDCRLFIPGSSFDQCPTQWVSGNLARTATKLSVVSGSVVELPSAASFPSLRVALLSSNDRLKSISATALRCMEQLVVLDLKKCTVLTWLPNSISTLQSLELLDLSSCNHLLSLPHSIGKLGNLRLLRLSGCLSLTGLPRSLGRLSRLEMLDLSMCARLRRLPAAIGRLSSLETLKLLGCYSLHSLPTSMVSLRKLKLLELSGCSNLTYSLPCLEQLKLLAGLQKCATMAIPINLWKLGQIEVLHLCSLKNLTYLPQLVGKLQRLRHLNLSSCRSLEYLPEDLGSLFLLQKLDLSHTAVRKLPDSLGQLNSLVVLCLRGCSRLLCVPPSISFLPKLEILDMAECWDLVIIPAFMGSTNSLPELLELDMAGCSIKQLPYFSAGALPKLQKLHLTGCQNLTSLPETFGTLTSLEKIDFEGCKALSSLQNAGLGNLKRLSWLGLRNCCALNNLPVSEITALESLKFLDVSGCSGLSPFPEPLLCCAQEQRFTLVRWGAVWH